MERRIKEVTDSILAKKGAELREKLRNSFIAPQRNPIREVTTPEGILHVLGNFKEFTFVIPGILIRAQAALASSPDVYTELDMNIREELGHMNVPDALRIPVEALLRRTPTHYDLLCYYLQTQYGFEAADFEPNDATLRFIRKVMSYFRYNISFAYAAGAAYALETSAILELQTLELKMRELSQLKGLVISFDTSPLKQFIDMHVAVIKQDHSDGLINALEKSNRITEERHGLRTFEFGFKQMVETMERWWMQLAAMAKEL